MPDFISENDLHTFERWLKYQAVDLTTLTAEELAMWRGTFDEAKARATATPKIGVMKLEQAGKYRYAVAERDGSDLWLGLWIKRSGTGLFVFVPRADRKWNPHTSYHLSGRYHLRSYNKPMLVRQLQPLTGTFHGVETLGGYGGFDPKSVGAICDPAAFSGVVEVTPGILGPTRGKVLVDLVEPGCEPTTPFMHIVQQEVFRDFVPWVVVRIGVDEP